MKVRRQCDAPNLAVERTLLNFVNGMLHSIGSVELMQMSIDRYYREVA